MTIAEQNKNKMLGTKTEKLWQFYLFLKGFAWQIDRWQGTFVFFVTKGSLKISINDLETYVVNSKEMFLVQEDSSYTIEVLRHSQITTCQFHTEALLSEQKLIDELVPLCINQKQEFIKLPINGAILSYLTLLQLYVKDDIVSDCFFDLKRQELLTLLFAYYSKVELARFLQSIVSENIQFKEFIINNYRNVKNVSELAALANYSTSGFIKRFQKCFNDSPYGWMQKQRAKQILIEIKQGVKSLQEIAVEYRFSSYQHFSNFCKKQFGFPPTKIIYG
jgi:AraC-like DNA-binding protein